MITYAALMLIPAVSSLLVFVVAREVIPLFVEPHEPAPKRRKRRRIRLSAKAA